MNPVSRLHLALVLLTPGIVPFAKAAIIEFTGGEVTLRDGTTQTTGNSGFWNGVDHYIEDGFKLDFVFSAAPPPPGSPVPDPPPHSSYIGDYYHVGNDVIHGHWMNGSGSPTDLTMIEITRVGGGAFDLNYFVLTSNSHYGPEGTATGTEQTWIKASNGFAQLLPSETWGFSSTAIYLGSAFDAVTSVQFYTTNGVECFGMDLFYIDEPPPTASVPDSASTLALLGLGLGGLATFRRSFRGLAIRRTT